METPCSAVGPASCQDGLAAVDEIREVLKGHPKVWMYSHGTVTGKNLRVEINGAVVIDTPVDELRGAFSGQLESQLAAEVVTA